MAKKTTAAKTSVPGTIYLNKKRYWWKVQLPGEATPKARPLKPVGAKFATTDYSVACQVAGNLCAVLCSILAAGSNTNPHFHILVPWNILWIFSEDSIFFVSLMEK